MVMITDLSMLQGEMENRLYERFKTGSECTIECAIAQNVKIQNISLGGICLKTSQHVNTHHRHMMKIITGKNEKILLTGEVVRSSFRSVIKHKDNFSHVYDAGLIFVDQTDSQKNFLKKLTRRLSR